ncbi:MAG: FAD-dependent oxidoreductase [Anaerolineales bacterium]|jgi:NAD(P)H-nitrite reductase large subunit
MTAGYVIVGSGAAGIAAVEILREIDPRAKITLVTADRDGYYSRPGLAYLLTGQLPEKQLFPLTAREYAQLRIETIHDRALAVDADEHRLVLEQHGSIEYERLLLAVGAQANMPALEGIDLEGVVKLDTLSDARRILKLARKSRRAVVIGGGITAIELAEGLAAQGVETHYFLRRERYWPGVLDSQESGLVERRLEREGIRVHHHTEIERITGKRGKVSGVETTSGTQVDCQMVAVAIGIRPRLELARSSGLKIGRGILVDERLRTSAEDVFAAGDAAQVFDTARGEFLLDSLWWPAVEQGKIAGRNMAGHPASYRKPVAMNVTRIGGLTTTLIGAVGGGDMDRDLVSIARGDSEAWRQAPHAFAIEHEHEADRLRLLMEDNTIVGALLMGDQTLSLTLQELILRQVDIGAIRDDLISSQVFPGDLLTSFWRQWQEAGRALES